MARIYGGIDEAELQILIRETMQDLIAQRDDSIQALSERLDKVDERTRQGLAGFDERVEQILKQIHQKVDMVLMESHISSQETVTTSKFEAVEYQRLAAEDRLTSATQRVAQIVKDIERKDEESRDTNERLDDLNHRFQHKADCAYVDVRIAELRTQVQRKAEVEDFDHSVVSLRETVAECRQKLAEKDDQMHMMLQQLAGKVEATAVNAVVEEQMNQMSLKGKSLGDGQISLENRFKSSAQHNVAKAGSSGAYDDSVRSLPVAQVERMLPTTIAGSLGGNSHEQQMSPRSLANGSSQLSVAGRMSPAGSYAPEQRAAALLPPQQAGSPRASLERGGSSLRAESEAEAAQVLRTSQMMQAQHTSQMMRSQSVPGLRRQGSSASAPCAPWTVGTSTVSASPGMMSPASSATTTPRLPGFAFAGNASTGPLNSLLWPPQVGKQAVVEGIGLGRGAPGQFFHPGMRPAQQPLAMREGMPPFGNDMFKR